MPIPESDMGPCTYKAPHVVVFPFPAQGHVSGAMDIARKLASLGVSITFVCTEAYIANMMKQGFNADGLPIRLLGLPDGLPPNRSMTDRVDQINVLIDATENMGSLFEDLLIKLNRENGIACVLFDFMLWWIGRLCKKLDLRSYIFYAMSASFFSYLSYIPEFVSQGRLPLGPHTDLNDASNVFNISGFPSLHVSEVPDISWSPNALCSFDYTLRSTTTWRDATGILFNTVHELEKEVIKALRHRAPKMDIRAVGPILPPHFLSGEMGMDVMHGESVNAQRCLRWLDEQPPSSVLYIAFGTIASPSRAQLNELAMGLEASNERFLWVVRVADGQYEEAHYMGAEVKGKEMNDSTVGSYNCTAGGLLPSGFEERTRGRGVVLWELAPQRKILAHRATGGFLTHCGWNSTLEGLCQGVPMLCCPMLGDQGMNAKFVVEVLQIGTLLQKQGGVVGNKEVQRQVQQLMDPRSPMRLIASRIRDSASLAALPGGSSYKDLHAFIQTLSSHSHSFAST